MPPRLPTQIIVAMLGKHVSKVDFVVECRENVPYGSLLGTGEVVDCPCISSWEDGVNSNARDVYCEVAECDIVLDGFCFGEEDPVGDNEQTLRGNDEWHAPLEFVCEKG